MINRKFFIVQNSEVAVDCCYFQIKMCVKCALISSGAETSISLLGNFEKRRSTRSKEGDFERKLAPKVLTNNLVEH